MLNIDFKQIDYLQTGNAKQRLAYRTLTDNNILDILYEFDPILVGTIPINIDIENSDLDIICYIVDREYFKQHIERNFDHYSEFKIWENNTLQHHAVVASFQTDDFEIEIFGQNVPTSQQNAYRHMIIEHQLLIQNGKEFRNKVIELKQKGMKTEPAFAHILGLEGNPYEALLRLES
ncbi:DUF4269 domain-containing protein [Prolixibacteraceae bacterium JC049]|nr:DUF4269 domain-containing protein [Prolixibacteraceae bacterium JC049]